MQDKTTEIFRDAPVPKAVISNVIPSIISMIMVLIYNLADTFFIGQTKNAYMVAAISVATPAFLLFMAVGMLFGIGGTSLISRSLGEGKTEKAKNASAFCFWTGLCIGIVAMVIIFIFAEPVSRAIGASDDTVGYAAQYLRIVSTAIPFLILSNSFSNIIRAEGKANIAMLGMLIGNLINIVLDPVMILGFGWNVAGAAIATVLGNVFAAGFYIWHLLSKNAMLSIHPKYYKAENGIATGVFAIGVPASLNSILMSLSNIIVNNIMVHYGDMAVLRFSLILAFCLSAVMTVICYCGAGPLVHAFLEDPDAFSYGMSFARIYIYSGPVMGLLFVFVNAIQSTGAALPALILSISRQGIIYLPVLFLFRSIFDSATMLAAAQPITDYLSTTLAIVLFIFTYRKYFPQVKDSQLHNLEE